MLRLLLPSRPNFHQIGQDDRMIGGVVAVKELIGTDLTASVNRGRRFAPRPECASQPRGHLGALALNIHVPRRTKRGRRGDAIDCFHCKVLGSPVFCELAGEDLGSVSS
jgi:hypothetical protein